MKTTDSVMREEIIEFFSHNPTKQSARNFLTRRLSHSLAEARREWVEEMVNGVQDCMLMGDEGADDLVRLDDVLDLLTRDNPERKA